MPLMYMELSDFGSSSELPPMAPFAVRESGMSIGRGDTRGGYTMPSMPSERVPPIGGDQAERRPVAEWIEAPCEAPSEAPSEAPFNARGLIDRRHVQDRGRIAPTTPMMGMGHSAVITEIPFAVLVVLVLNVIMMLLCALALLLRGGRSG
jgi:hypothetical protein